jgi:hypothetical protein
MTRHRTQQANHRAAAVALGRTHRITSAPVRTVTPKATKGRPRAGQRQRVRRRPPQRQRTHSHPCHRAGPKTSTGPERKKKRKNDNDYQPTHQMAAQGPGARSRRHRLGAGHYPGTCRQRLFPDARQAIIAAKDSEIKQSFQRAGLAGSREAGIGIKPRSAWGTCRSRQPSPTCNLRLRVSLNLPLASPHHAHADCQLQ